ncbi:sn-glycerol-1-phosphate dehydrogenase [Thermobacillus xylanilyticus]|jgi:glycerol-1-phosphate dehydrogenase [NAD(P)+]|uniref:Sn-glycerol-1-phosphate dehydrogenase n=1 Tax=Thermobacillus xylanilyticus TaxID=76633 RepID=A0ABM8V465_THEXY|nr:sn-glycerol-1-phosphate dehydrogenase [Thermobacillus xylanilyticus]REJ17408.1 MAG: sn-glycerol-1-phosphate dehydrogenase [Paenibacillaceae bacterium]CAG5086218.1 sn-glycerol-1-phosphate dehydrogenase [Thermobacillus xylanilyticus]
MNGASEVLGGGKAAGLPDPIRLARGAADEAVPYLLDAGLKRALFVADETTARVIGSRLAERYGAAGGAARLEIIRPNAAGDVVADEASVLQAIIAAQHHGADAIAAAGSGTIHDIVRYAACTLGLPFVSVPTAPSVDGFTSKGAPLILRGEKITLPAAAPVAVFADLDVLCAAPQPLIAAGFGDMLGKYTSLFDWVYGRETAGEPYDEDIAGLTRGALERCVSHAEAIGEGTEEGVRALMQSLIESGIALLRFGQSHPASGAEHHISHYWEMHFLRTGRRQVLHGAKVGVACAEVADLYKRYAAEGRPLPDACRRMLAELPDGDELRRLLRVAGGPAVPAELGIEPELRDEALRRAHVVRLNRHTLLRAINGE